MVDENILIANMMYQMFPEKKFLRENLEARELPGGQL